MSELLNCPLSVRSLKRLLIGSISLSEDSELDVEMKEKEVEEPNQEGDVALLTGRFLKLENTVFK